MMFFGVGYNNILNMTAERPEIKYKVLFCRLIVYRVFFLSSITTIFNRFGGGEWMLTCWDDFGCVTHEFPISM